MGSVQVGQVYRCIKDLKTKGIVATVRVNRLSKPNLCWPGKLNTGKVYAFCTKTVTGKKPRLVTLDPDRLMGKDFELVIPKAAAEPFPPSVA